MQRLLVVRVEVSLLNVLPLALRDELASREERLPGG